jgi:hypothetical protein
VTDPELNLQDRVSVLFLAGMTVAQLARKFHRSHAQIRRWLRDSTGAVIEEPAEQRIRTEEEYRTARTAYAGGIVPSSREVSLRLHDAGDGDVRLVARCGEQQVSLDPASLETWPVRVLNLLDPTPSHWRPRTSSSGPRARDSREGGA